MVKKFDLWLSMKIYLEITLMIQKIEHCKLAK